MEKPGGTQGFKKTKIQEKANRLLSGTANEILLMGGSRSGKTFLLIRALIIRALKCTSRHCVLRKLFIDVKQSIWLDTIPKVFKLCFPDLYPRLDKMKNNQDHYIKFPNGSEIWIGGLDDKERVEKILGKEYSTIYFNECSQMSIDSIDTAKTRLAEKNNLIKRLYYDLNPTSKKHWSYFKFILLVDPETKQKIDPGTTSYLLMNPYDNKDNLDESYLKILDALPPSKRKRFRDGQFSDEITGEIFDTKWIKRMEKLPADTDRIIVGHDPAVTSKITSDEHGLIVCARKGKFGYVFMDKSGIYTPKVAAQKSINAYHESEADKIVSEVNNGGDYIETVLHDIDDTVAFKSVRASRGKVKRAEPVASLYEQGRIYHIGDLSELEAEMGDFKTDEKEMSYSPNRADAMCWAFTELFNLYKGEPQVRTL